jgi:hypothetical protein
MLGIEDHGILTYMIDLDYGGSGQGAGGYAMDTPVHEDGKFKGRVGTSLLAEHLLRIFKVVGVNKWEDLPGKYIRVKATNSGVQSIGHALKDTWFDLNFQGDAS